MSPEPKTNILMVDDQPKNLLALEAILGSLDENLVRAQSGQEALEFLLKSDFAVILLDIQMPGMDGYETAEMIRRREKSKHTPIIFVTAINKTDENILKGYSLGAVDYLCKPIDPEILKAKVGAFVDLHKTVEDQKRQMEMEAEKAKVRSLSFLAEASHVLSASLDFEKTLKSIADLSVPFLADYCIVDIVEENGSLRQVAVTDIKPERKEWLKELRERYPMDPNSRFGPDKVLRTGQTEIVTEINDYWLRSTARDKEHLELLKKMAFRSYMIVPLITRGRTIGLISLVSAESGRKYVQADLVLAEDLAGRAALAVDNARLYSESQKAAQLEAEARKESENANRLKDEFIATISHELKTPLQNIIGWSQMLKSGRLDEPSRYHAMEIIDRNAKAQSELINDLLDVSRIITGQLRLNISPVDLAQVIEAAVNSVQPAAQAKDIILSVSIDFAAGFVTGDANRLQQVVWNLLSNSIKFTPKGGRVEVRLERDGEWIKITVNDTGKGILPDFLPYVFDRFRQADGSITRTFGGLGLGLAIVKHLTELMNGTVLVSSEGEGRGATFTLRFPVMDDKLKPFVTERAVKVVESLPLDYQKLLTGLKLLVVDDEPDTCEMLKIALEHAGAEVKAVTSASEALNELERWNPSLLISDIAMAGGDGYDLIKRVRALDYGQNLPAVALTAFARSEDRTRALMAGYQMHVCKPVDPVELVTVIASLTGLIGNGQ
jgi:signal transduction histidine kinase/DNA-binding response OmpR family regulator